MLNKIGTTAFFGGSFDPPHLGHLAVAVAAVESGRCDQVLWVPAFSQPLKPGRRLASFADRCAMVNLLIAGHPEFFSSDIEGRLGREPSYTIDMLAALESEGNAIDALLIGADSLLDLYLWHRGMDLAEKYYIITYPRSGCALDRASLEAHWCPELTDKLLSGVLPGTFFEISSTEIRKTMVKSSFRSDINSGVISPEVAAYISAHRLYGDSEQKGML